MTGRKAVVVQHGVLALLAYVPLLLTSPGWVAADTKAYLYLDPDRLLARAWSLWDPNVAFGTVTHQNIGYLWPMGPWYWVFEHLGAPDWIAQRIWMGSLLFLAGAGFLWFARTVAWTRRQPAAAMAGALLYALTPYVLNYVGRISVLLLPWAALPWLLGLLQRALRTGSWRHPAAFALVVATAGGVNATALVLAGIAPLLWIVFAVVVHGDATWRRAGTSLVKIAVLTVPVNLWWVAGLAVQSGWGLDVLRYTETVETVARSSLASEVLRGLGYWFLYGTDKLGPWIEPGRTFTQHPWVIVLGFVLPVLAVVAASMLRWRYRAFAVALVLVGTTLAVGAHPYDSPSPLGAAFKHLAESSTAGLALRSTGRVVPLVVLGIAMLVSAWVAALRRRGQAVAIGICIVAVAANPPLWTGQFVGDNLRRPEHVPAYWERAIASLGDDGDTRILEVPGSDFATYRWGNTVDPITPGLTDRPYVARELVPFGTEASADLLIAFDRRIQEGVLDPAAVVPFARLVGAGDVVLRADLEFERYRTARPQAVRRTLASAPAGLGPPRGFGSERVPEASAELPMRDEIWFQTRDVAAFSPVEIREVRDPVPIVRARDARGAVLLAGDGEGLVEAGAAGLLDGPGVVLYTAGLADRPALLDGALRDGAAVVVTDTNRKRSRRWGTVRDNDGYTERRGERPLRDDPSDNRLPLFPAAPPDASTVVEQRGVRRVEATSYGNPVTYTPADRAAHAVDGDLATSWEVGALGPVGGERLLVETKGTTASSIEVVQARFGPRTVVQVGVVLDGKHVRSYTLGASSFDDEGQRLDLGRERHFRTLELVIEKDTAGRLAHYDDQNGVGFREVRIPGVRVDEVVRLPSDVLRKVRTSQALTLLFARLRANPAEPFAADEEPAMARAFRLPTARAFEVSGRARVDGAVPDDRLDALVGTTSTLVARSSGRIQGDLAASASAAIDGDPSTAWRNSIGPQAGAWLEVERPRAEPLDHLDLVLVVDGAASVPVAMSISDETGEKRRVRIPPLAERPVPGATARARISFPALQGRRIRVEIDKVAPVTSIDWFSKRPIQLPVAIAELGISGEVRRRRAVPTDCRGDLLTVDDRPLPVRLSGDPFAPGGLEVTSCGGALGLDAGEHVLRARRGTGIDLDRLMLSSAAGGAAATLDPGEATGPAASAGASVRTLSRGRTSMRVELRARQPVWFVLGQSHSVGWQAEAEGSDLGEPVLADGFANGWLVDPGPDGAVTLHLEWRPQRLVRTGIIGSVAGALVCLAIVAGAALRRRRATPLVAPAPALREPFLTLGPPMPWSAAVGTGLAIALAAALVVSPLLGAAAGPIALVALRHRLGRLTWLAGAGFVGLAGLYTAFVQVRDELIPDFGWTDFLAPAHVLAWAGLVLLALALVTDWRRR